MLQPLLYHCKCFFSDKYKEKTQVRGILQNSSGWMGMEGKVERFGTHLSLTMDNQVNYTQINGRRGFSYIQWNRNIRPFVEFEFVEPDWCSDVLYLLILSTITWHKSLSESTELDISLSKGIVSIYVYSHEFVLPVFYLSPLSLTFLKQCLNADNISCKFSVSPNSGGNKGSTERKSLWCNNINFP